MIRFKLDWQKTVEAISYIASVRPGVTQYYIGKILFFADKEHLLDYGRPITGDKYVAMEHGPVPSATRDMLRHDSGLPDAILDTLNALISIHQEGNKQMVYQKPDVELSHLSRTDKAYLREAIAKYAAMSFPKLKEISHADPAYEDAWSRDGNANEMDVGLWLDELDEPELARQQVNEFVSCGVHA